MEFSAKYTTAAKKQADTSLEKIESKKVELSADTFALGETIELFNMNIQNLIRSMAK